MLYRVSTSFVVRAILTVSKVKLRTFQIPVLSSRCLASCPKKFTVSYNHSSGNSVFLGSTIGQVVSQAADQSGDQLAFVFRHQNVRRTFTQVDKESNQLAASFLELGLKPGERIALWSTNCYEWILTQVAAAKAGLILVQVNTAYQPDELEYCLNKTSCKALVAAEGFKTQDYFQELNHLLPEITASKPGQLQSKRCPDLHTVVMLTRRNYPGVYKFEDILQVAGNEKLQEIKELVSKIQFDDPVCIQLTSGSTGQAKAATLSHFNLINNGMVFYTRISIPGVKPVDCIPLPLFHTFGSLAGSMATFVHRKVTVFPSAFFDPLATLEAIEKERCSVVMGTPTMFVDMVNHPVIDQTDLSSLKTAVTGGAPCPVELWRQIEEKMKLTNIINGYGTTENSPATLATRSGERIDKKYHTVGTPFDHVEVKIIDKNGHIVPVNTKGELCTRGHVTFLGYWGDEEKTSEVISPDRWYRTGDIAMMDEDGYVSIVGRIKEMIIRGGENIYPREVEEFLHTHPFVAEVQVVGVPDPRLGEEVIAWVKLKTGKTLTEKELREYCNGKISYFKIPRHITFVEDFPRTSSGKITKYKIKEEFIKKLRIKH